MKVGDWFIISRSSKFMRIGYVTKITPKEMIYFNDYVISSRGDHHVIPAKVDKDHAQKPLEGEIKPLLFHEAIRFTFGDSSSAI